MLHYSDVYSLLSGCIIYIDTGYPFWTTPLYYTMVCSTIHMTFISTYRLAAQEGKTAATRILLECGAGPSRLQEELCGEQ